jgi:hypothetical protein
MFSPAYEHTQHGWMHYLLLGVAAGILAAGLVCPPNPVTDIVLPVSAAVLVFCAFCFRTLTVRDAEDHLTVVFGPLPFFRKEIPYQIVTGVATDRTDWLDGWGVHYIPRRGWVWNLSGFTCVRLELGEGKALRIGTDDAENLAAFLKTKLAQG